MLTNVFVPVQVLCSRSRLVLSKTPGSKALAALRVGRTRTFSAASSDEPYVAVSHTDSGESNGKGVGHQFLVNGTILVTILI